MYTCKCGERYEAEEAGRALCPKCGATTQEPAKADSVAGEGQHDSAAAMGMVQDDADKAADVPEGGYKCCRCGTVLPDAKTQPAQPTDKGPLCPQCLAEMALVKLRAATPDTLVKCHHCQKPIQVTDEVYVQVHAVEPDPGVIVPAVWPLHGTCVKPTAEPDASNMLRAPSNSLGVAAVVHAAAFKVDDSDLSE